MLDVVCWILDVGYWMLDVGCWILDVVACRGKSGSVWELGSGVGLQT